MRILAVGTVAYDSIETPFGKAERVLGGSGTYFSMAASLFAPVRVVAVVGEDFERRHIEDLSRRGIDVRGIQVKPGKTFFWAGRYDYDLNVTHTVTTELNVFADFHPELPEGYADAEILFLGNIHPDLQYEVLQQATGAKLRMMDTMNYWIEGFRPQLERTLAAVDVVTMNESEARMFTGTNSLVGAARRILAMGPKAVVMKKGESGAVLFADGVYFVAPAYPLEEVKDPTGAGDSFAGGFLGYLAQRGDLSPRAMRRALIHGSVVASYTVEDFGVGRLATVTPADLARRYEDFKTFTHFERDVAVD